MKAFVPFVLLLGAIGVAGCAHQKSMFAPVPAPPPPGFSQPVVTPDNSLAGKVVSYNSVGRFVVLSFPVGPVPALNQDLFLYRAGLKVGEVKITGPQRDNNIVADLVNGEAQVGDEARDE